MGNEQSTFADIPVYYRPGYGVSLYKPAEKVHIGYGLRKRTIKTETDEVTTGLTEEVLYSDESSINSQPDGPHRNHVQDFRDLRIEIDESGFIEDDNDIDGNPPSLSNSLKGNFSPRSLYEKARQYNSLTSANDSDDECVHLKEETDDSPKIKNEFVEEENKFSSVNNNDSVKSLSENEIKVKLIKPKQESLTPNGNLESSSVLLTPPPEDELSSSGQPFTTSSAGISFHSTKSDVSDIHSEVVDSFSRVIDEPDERYNQDLTDGGALTDEDQENLSPLPFDYSSEKSSDKRLHLKALILKLDELKSRSRCNSESSPSKSCSSNSCLEHRRVASLGSKDTTFSGVSSPELELLNSETKQTSVVTSGTFDNLEDEIHEVEDEFITISSQLQDLANKCSNCDTCSNAGLEILDGIYRRYPSIRGRHKDKGIQNTNFKLSNYTEVETNQDSDIETDSVDLSWDLDNILDMLYSETSDSSSMQNPLVTKLKKEQAKRSESCSPVDFLEETLFNSSVELDGSGSLYEDDFHLQLGSTRLSQSSSHTPTEPSQQGEITSQQGEAAIQQGKTCDQKGEITSQSEESVKLKAETVCNVGTKLSLTEYAEREWRGTTPRAELMKKAYEEIPKYCQYCHLRQIRGDNYCAIRGTVFQCLLNNLPPFTSLSSKDCVIQKLSQAFSAPSSGLKHWTFANRLSYTRETLLEVMKKCINSLYTKFEELQQHKLYSERDEMSTALLNSDAQCDLELMEGVKLLMLLKAIDLHNDMSQGNDVPIFVWLMFARDTSDTLELFVKNHLNPVGDSGGLEQVEMFLLGCSLGVRIQVFRLSQFGECDFVSYYPDDGTDDCQTVSLIAEDDRHYNVPVS